MVTVKKLSRVIAGAVLSGFCLGQEAARPHPGHSPFVPHENTLLSEAGGQNVLVVPPDALGRPAYYSAGTLSTLLATGQETGGAFSLLNIVSLPLFGTPPHIHTREDEVYYVLDGQVNFQLGSPTGPQNIAATPGTFAFLPKGRPHAWQNTGTTLANILVFPFPAGFEGFIIDQNQPVIDRSAPIPASPPTPEIFDIAQEYGLQVLSGSPSDFYESDTMKHLVIQPGSTNLPSFNEAGVLFTSLATREDTRGQVSVFDVALAPQTGSAQLVSNNWQSQAFYILNGDVTFQIGDKTTLGTPGTFVYLPAETSYAFQNLGTTPARTLLLTTPVSVPEPSSTLGLLGSGAFLGTAFLLKRKQKTKKTYNVSV
jgi:quercetin dioxygenase-like cupin family protein